MVARTVPSDGAIGRDIGRGEFVCLCDVFNSEVNGRHWYYENIARQRLSFFARSVVMFMLQIRTFSAGPVLQDVRRET